MRYLFLVVLLLAGCQKTDANIYGGMIGQNVVGNEVSVTVTNVWNQADAMPLADAHCKKYGRAARYVDIRSNAASFDCVKP